MMKLSICCAALKMAIITAALLCAAPSHAADLAASSEQPNTKMTLVTERAAVTAGTPIHAGILIEAKEGWHTYWENPGDAGMPTTLTWTLPEGFTAGAIDWPAPERLTEGPLVTHAYVGKVFLPVTLLPPSALAEHAYSIKVKVEVLVCKDICIPESATLQATLPVSTAEAPTTEYAGLFEQPRLQPTDTGAHYTLHGNRLILSVPLNALAGRDIKSAVFFMREQNLIGYASEQKLILDKDTLTLSIERTEEKPEGNVSGILTLTASDGAKTSYNITFAPATAPASLPVETTWFPLVLLLAVMGGLVLNLMPCVLPILSLKALDIAKKSHHKQDHVIRQGMAYTLGILVSFAFIAGLLLALRHAGESVGWGYQMQSPPFVGFLIYLLFIVGLSLSGVFHLPVLLGNIGVNGSSARGSFFTGVLATAVATPCTAPFMASAVGAALTLPAWQGLLVFEALGFGLALPFLLISLCPPLRRFLPKPGAWMEVFKQLLAFPMYASVIWLLWVLTLQTGAGGMVIALIGMLAITFIISMKSWFRAGTPAYPIIALMAYAVILALSLPALSHRETSTAAENADTVAYSKETLAALRASGKPVLVDATAAWCITCQVNARVALHTQKIMHAFKERGITLMIADWTRRNDEITEYLRDFGFSGVPLCVFYPAGAGKPIVLPQLLTEDIVFNIITSTGN